VTLTFGVLASMFSAIVGTKIVFDDLLQKRRVKTLSI